MSTTPNSPAQTAAQHLADVKRELVEDKAANAAAVAHAADLRDRALARDRSIMDDDFTRADAAVERTALLVTGTERAVARAQRALINVDDRLAVALLPMVQATFSDFDVSVSTTRPTGTPESLPSVVIVQSKPSQADTINGVLKGSVEIVLLRTRNHRDVDADVVERAIDNGGARVRVHPRGCSEIDGIVHEVLGVEVGSVFAELPVIQPYPNDAWRVIHFSRAVASDVVHAGDYSGAPISGMAGTGGGWSGGRTNVVRAEASEPSTVADHTTKGVRTRVIEVAISAVPAKGCPWTADDLRDIAVRTVEAQAGKAYSGLGRISAVSILSVEPLGRVGREVNARFTFNSRVAGTEVVPTVDLPPTPASKPRAVDSLAATQDVHGNPPGSHPGAAAVKRKRQ